MLLYQILFGVSVAFFIGSAALVLLRFFGSSGATILPFQDALPITEDTDIMPDIPLEVRYRELIELGMIQLEPEEQILIGCGKKGETEEVLVVTTHRAFIMTRRAGATFYAKQAFYVDHLRPIPSSAGMMGNKMILSDGVKTGAIDSPGDRGFLDDAKNVVRELNGLIRKAQQGTPNHNN